MANTQLGNVVDFDFTNSLRAVSNMGGSDDALVDPSDYVSILSLRTTLAAFDSFTYTSAVLDTMTVNDMVFAVRNIQDPTTIASYVSAQVARTS